MPGTSDESIFLRMTSLIQLLAIDSFCTAALEDRVIEIQILLISTCWNMEYNLIS